nr:caspase family protein [Rhodoplanes tepidamans]
MVAVAAAAGPARAEKRVALVIGNSGYRSVPSLPNTANDARAMAALLRNSGFDVVQPRHDLGVLDFKRALREFMGVARDADIAVVYYAGHGVEVKGGNYLIPVDAKLARDYDVEDEAIPLERVMWSIEGARVLRLVILDACRDNPFLGKMQRTVSMRAVVNGLATVEPAAGNTLVAFAAKAGSVAADGVGRHSPFTAALLNHIAEPGLDVRLAFGRVRDEVLRETGGAQEPFVYGSLGGTTVALVPAAKPAAPVVTAQDLQRDYELAERVGTVAAFETFLARHGSGFYAELARAQIAKLGERAGQGAVAAAMPRLAPPPPPVAAPAAVAPAAVAPGGGPADPVAAEAACRRDRDRLARLRADPAADEVLRFERELACDALRAQVVRLRESVVGPAPAAAAAAARPPAPAGPAPAPALASEASRPAPAPALPLPSSSSPPPAATAPARPQVSGPAAAAAVATGSPEACRREQEQIARLRATPRRDAIVRLERELTCEPLRPQLVRLRESVE